MFNLHDELDGTKHEDKLIYSEALDSMLMFGSFTCVSQHLDGSNVFSRSHSTGPRVSGDAGMIEQDIC